MREGHAYMRERRIHVVNVMTSANGLFEGFKSERKERERREQKSVTNLKRKISVKIFKQNYGVLICKYDLAYENKQDDSYVQNIYSNFYDVLL
jgi:hypothetical protein